MSVCEKHGEYSVFCRACDAETLRAHDLATPAPSAVVEGLNRELVGALKTAHHALTVTHNLRATDLSREVFEAHVTNGTPFESLEFTIDNSRELDAIETALTKAEAAGGAVVNLDQELLADYDRKRNTEGLEHLTALRSQGWMVAVHNDYRLRGDLHTFWLLTHPDGHYVKGEGVNDGDALEQCRRAAERLNTTTSAREGEVERLRKALEFYANEAWETDGDQGYDHNDNIIEVITTEPSDALLEDKGQRARAALKGER